MCARSKSSEKYLRRPFEKTVARRAARLAGQYQIVLAFEDGEWFGHGLELPNVFGDGRTPDACVASTRQALALAVATMLEAGQRPPAPARSQVRTEQVNVRLTAEEKAVLESTARDRGFRGLSDFLRAGALAFTK
jgi:predicted RNase H-like HicB family nuclease